MRKSLGLILVVAVAAVALLYSQGYLSGTSSSANPEPITVVQGWNQVTVPDSWHSTTAKALCAGNPIITALSHEVDGKLSSYLPKYSDAYSFTIEPGSGLWIYASSVGVVNPVG